VRTQILQISYGYFSSVMTLFIFFIIRHFRSRPQCAPLAGRILLCTLVIDSLQVYAKKWIHLNMNYSFVYEFGFVFCGKADTVFKKCVGLYGTSVIH